MLRKIEKQKKKKNLIRSIISIHNIVLSYSWNMLEKKSC